MKKVIAAMSVGKDVSALFADVINCVQSNSIETKKLVYLYIVNYAKAQPDLAILAVNTFRKDSLDPNPLIRALAVRTMGYIRLEAVAEYLMDPVRRCCRDSDPYVRKTAAISVAKLHAIAPQIVEEQGFIEILQTELIADSNPMVVANTVAALTEISSSSGRSRFGFLSKPDTANIMLNALNECNEWAQVMILDVLAANYKPVDSKQALTVVDRVTARLSHSNSAVVLGAVRVVVGLLDRLGSTETVRSVCRKLTGPLVTLLAESEPQIQYIALRNISLIMAKYPSVLAGEVKVFYCKYNDPVYVKLEKLEALMHLVSEKTADSVLSELKEYASEVDVEFVRKSVRCIGRFAIRVEAAADKCVSALIELIETKVSYVVQEAVVVMRDVFRRFPGRYEAVISALCDNLDTLDEPEAKAGMIWILGEYADRIDKSGDLISSFFTNFVEESHLVQLELLTASVKYFLKVKDASHGTLVKLLTMCTEECENPDLRDRAFIYWRLLSIDPETSRKILLAAKPLIVDEVSGHELSGELLTTLIGEIGTLSSVYHLIPNAFVVSSPVLIDRDEEESSNAEEEHDISRAKVIAAVRAKIAASDVAPNVLVEKNPSQDDDDEEEEEGDEEERDDDSGSSDEEDEEDEEDEQEEEKDDIPDLKVASIPVLPPSAPAGSKGTAGLGVDASICKVGRQMYMYMYLKNATSGPLSQFAVQFNKNSFGLSPKFSSLQAAVGVTEIVSGSVSPRIAIALEANKLNSGTPPSEKQLSVQVAVRTNIDIFYFIVPFDLHVVLDRSVSGGITKENFKASWEALKSSEKSVQLRPFPREKLIPRCLQGGFRLIDEGSSGSPIAFSAVTVNKLLLMMLIDEKGNCALRASNVHLVPHACVLMAILFGLQP